MFAVILAMMASGLKGRTGSYGKNLRLLKGLHIDDDDNEQELSKEYADQNKWLFEVAWEVANKGNANVKPVNEVAIVSMLWERDSAGLHHAAYA